MMAGERDFSKLEALEADLDVASNDRLIDADALLAARRYASAVAMGVYALEIRLKARICRRLDLDALPKPFEIHDLASLLTLSGLLRRINDPSFTRTLDDWNEVERWSLPKQLNDLRYKPPIICSQPQARDFFAQLRDPPDGVLPWISSQP